MGIIRNQGIRNILDSSSAGIKITVKEKARILIVEDEPITANLINKILNNQGYRVVGTVNTGGKALDYIASKKPDLILMDIQLGDEMDGIETAQIIHEEFDLPLVYMTSYTDDDTLDRAKITEPFGYILKPVNRNSIWL